MENENPNFKPFARQILVCTDGECIPKKDAKKLIRQFREEIDVARQAGDLERTVCTRMGCAGVCENGPIVAVWPDGVWYQQVKKKAMMRIVAEHLVGGEPVEDHVFYRTPPVVRPALDQASNAVGTSPPTGKGLSADE